MDEKTLTAELGKLGIDVKDGKVRRADVKAVIDNVIAADGAAKKALIERLDLYYFDNDTWSNPEDWDGDSVYGTCDLTGEIGNTEPMQVLDDGGNIHQFDVLEGIAYILHGLAGAY